MTSKVMFNMLSLFAELEQDLMSLRIKEALKSKKSQVKISCKPKVTL